MYCTKCGKKFNPGEELCSKCGTIAVVEKAVKKETPVLAIIAIVLSVLAPLIGFGLGLVGVATYDSQKLKSLSARAITVSVSLFFVLCVATLLIFYLV